MKRHRNRASSVQALATSALRGVTLSEVLVSMLIMSVGVVSLATLFPISVLRTAQATQLTHSVFLRNNAEAAVESNLGLLSNAQIYGFNGLGVIDPLGVQLVGTLTVSSLGVGVGTPVGVVRRTDGLASSSITPAQRLALAEQLATLPDSWSLVREEAVTASSLSASPPTITVGNAPAGLNVRNGQYPSNARHRMVMFDATGRFAVLQPLYQVQQISPYTLSWWNVNGSGASLATGPYLPTGFMPTRVRIEAQDRRYTWMMTARKRWTPVGPVAGADGGAGVSGTDDDGVNGTDDNGELHISGSDDDPNWTAELDVAVFYNRSFRAADETLHTLTYSLNGTGFDGQPGVSGVNDDNDTVSPYVDEPDETGWPGSDDNRTVTVSLASQPYLKKGGYMLEPSQLKWYRILNIDLTSSTGNAILLLDQDVRNPSSPAGATITQGIFMRGIVEVFSLGSRTGQQ